MIDRPLVIDQSLFNGQAHTDWWIEYASRWTEADCLDCTDPVEITENEPIGVDGLFTGPEVKTPVGPPPGKPLSGIIAPDVPEDRRGYWAAQMKGLLPYFRRLIEDAYADSSIVERDAIFFSELHAGSLSRLFKEISYVKNDGAVCELVVSGSNEIPQSLWGALREGYDLSYVDGFTSFADADGVSPADFFVTWPLSPGARAILGVNAFYVGDSTDFVFSRGENILARIDRASFSVTGQLLCGKREPDLALGHGFTENYFWLLYGKTETALGDTEKLIVLEKSDIETAMDSESAHLYTEEFYFPARIFLTCFEHNGRFVAVFLQAGVEDDGNEYRYLVFVDLFNQAVISTFKINISALMQEAWELAPDTTKGSCFIFGTDITPRGTGFEFVASVSLSVCHSSRTLNAFFHFVEGDAGQEYPHDYGTGVGMFLRNIYEVSPRYMASCIIKDYYDTDEDKRYLVVMGYAPGAIAPIGLIPGE